MKYTVNTTPRNADRRIAFQRSMEAFNELLDQPVDGFAGTVAVAAAAALFFGFLFLVYMIA